MKFLYFTDLHDRATPPRSRTDDYHTALMRKVDEIIRIAKSTHIEAALFGGDLFDGSVPTLGTFVQLASQLRKFRKIYGNVGSHDYRGYQELTIPETGVGYLQDWGLFEVLNKNGVMFPDPFGSNVRVVGIPHTANQTPDDLFVEKGDEDYLIELVHGDIVFNQVPWPHILISDIKTEADLVLVGHYHRGFDPVLIGNTIFAHPGSVARTEITEADIQPAVYIISTGSDVPLWPEKVILQDVSPAEDVFQKVSTPPNLEVPLDQFIESLRALSQANGMVSLEDVVRMVGAVFPTAAVDRVLAKIIAYRGDSK